MFCWRPSDPRDIDSLFPWSQLPVALVSFAVPALTQIPKSKTNEEAVTGLLALAHDCHAAYGAGAEKASDPELKQALQKYAKQADSHIEQWRSRSSLWLHSCLAAHAMPHLTEQWLRMIKSALQPAAKYSCPCTPLL